MRQTMSEKKVKKIREQTGLPVKHVAVRGNTGHRKDLYLPDGRVLFLRTDGTIEDKGVKWSKI